VGNPQGATGDKGDTGEQGIQGEKGDTGEFIENGFSFFTEKIAKPILAKRLFLVASGQYYLRNLRELGFHTFGDIIDESYDHEPNADRRIKMLLKQVDYLCTQDPQDILSRAHSILEHNYYVMTHVDWQGSIMKKIHELM
jgi:hypothetical protein